MINFHSVSQEEMHEKTTKKLHQKRIVSSYKFQVYDIPITSTSWYLLIIHKHVWICDTCSSHVGKEDDEIIDNCDLNPKND